MSKKQKQQKENLKTRLTERWKAAKLAFAWTYQASKTLSFLVILLSVLAGLLPVLIAYTYKLILDALAGQNTAQGLYSQLAIGILGLIIINGSLKTIESLIDNTIGMIKRAHFVRLERHAVSKLMDKVASLDIEYFEDPKYFDTLYKSNSNIGRITDLFFGMLYWIQLLVGTISTGIIVIGFDFKVFVLILFGAIPGIYLSLKRTEITWSAFSSYSPISRHAEYYKNLLTQKPEAIKEIKLFGLKDYFLDKFRNLFTDYIKKNDRAILKNISYTLIDIVFSGIIAIIVGWMVAQSYSMGVITIGTFTFVWAMAYQFMTQIKYSTGWFENLYSNASYLTPIVELLGFKPILAEPLYPIKFPKKIRKGIEFKNVTFYYPRARKPALKNLNLFIKPKENIALVGENGSGKTTLVKLLCRLYDVSEGEILIDDVNIKEYSQKDLHDNLGIIFQDFMKYEATAQENIGFGKLKDINNKQKIDSAAKKSGALEFIRSYKEKFKVQLGKQIKENGTELSGGQWQKIALARAFFRDAPILILDEPTAAVDARAEYNLFKRFQKLTKDKITFLISHRFSTVRMADRILVINKGKIIEQGTHKDLLKKKGVYAELFNLQALGYK